MLQAPPEKRLYFYESYDEVFDNQNILSGYLVLKKENNI